MGGYKVRNVWNLDETGCFYRVITEKSLAEKKSDCKGREKSKTTIENCFYCKFSQYKGSPNCYWKNSKAEMFLGDMRS